jgi:lipid A 3-O-deacylase
MPLILLFTIFFMQHSSALEAKTTLYLAPYLGFFDILDEEKYPLIGGELRTNKILPSPFNPKIGGYITEKGSSYLYLGFNIDLPLYQDKVFITPGFSLGSYSQKKGKNLGGTLEFRSSIELSYKMENNHRIGGIFTHISNANIYQNNPGAEDLLITYLIPIKISGFTE